MRHSDSECSCSPWSGRMTTRRSQDEQIRNPQPVQRSDAGSREREPHKAQAREGMGGTREEVTTSP